MLVIAAWVMFLAASLHRVPDDMGGDVMGWLFGCILISAGCICIEIREVAKDQRDR